MVLGSFFKIQKIRKDDERTTEEIVAAPADPCAVGGVADLAQGVLRLRREVLVVDGVDHALRRKGFENLNFSKTRDDHTKKRDEEDEATEG